MPIAESIQHAHFYNTEVRELAHLWGLQKNADTGKAFETMQALDERVCSLMEKNTALMQKTAELKEKLSHAKATVDSHKRHLDLVIKNCQEQVASAQALAEKKIERDRNAKARDDAKSTALEAEFKAIINLKKQLDALRDELESKKNKTADPQVNGDSFASDAPSTTPAKTPSSRSSSLHSSTSPSPSTSAIVLPPISRK